MFFLGALLVVQNVKLQRAAIKSSSNGAKENLDG